MPFGTHQASGNSGHEGGRLATQGLCTSGWQSVCVLVPLLILSGCGGGRDGTTKPPDPPVVVALVTVTPDSAILQIGATLQLSAVVRDAANIVLTGRLIAWASENPAVASVSASGLVTAVAAGGPVRVTATSESKSATATLTVNPASVGTIGSQGGTVMTPVGGSTVTFSQGAITGSLSVQVRDTVPVDPRYTVLSKKAVHLVLPIAGGNAAFQSNGSVQLSIPISRDLKPGTVGYVRARFKDVPGDYWAPATSTGNGRLTLSMPSSGFPEFKTLLGMDVLDVVFDVEEFSLSGTASLRPGAAGTSTRANSLGTIESNCPDLPANASLALYAPCKGGRLLRIVQAGTGQNSRIGIVLVHGWLPGVANGDDYYREQDLHCETVLTNVPCVWTAPPTPDLSRDLPGIAYFKSLRAALEPQLAGQFGGAPLYVFDYQSYREYTTSGQQLSDSLKRVAATDGLIGVVIVGHSMGGLVARQAAQILEAQPGYSQLVRGIITLATPHMGTPLPALKFAAVFAPSIDTPGGQSLLPEFFLPRNERVPAILYAGDIDGTAILHQPLYYWLWRLLCANVRSDCHNDGVVPVSSALPTIDFAGKGSSVFRSVFTLYDHSQMKYEDGATNDPHALYSNIAADLGLLLRRVGATGLSFNPQPANATVAVPLSALSVAVLDGKNKPLLAPPYQVTLTLGNNPSGATLSGTKTITTAGGVATFSDLSLDRAGAGYTLVATAVGLSVTSSSFTIAFTPVASVTVAPGAASIAVGGTQPFTATLKDVGGNPLTGRTVTWSTSNASAATVNSATGVATGVTAGTATVTATSEGKTGSAIVSVTAGASFTRLSGALAHNCGLTSSGTAYCWGLNFAGQLGDGTTTESRRTPVLVAGNLAFTSLSVGGSHTCGLTSSGAAYCWGYNRYGQLGDGTTTDRRTPVLVAGNLAFTSLSAGVLHTCARTSSGAAYCWGSNYYGALGDGTLISRLVPTPVKSP